MQVNTYLGHEYETILTHFLVEMAYHLVVLVKLIFRFNDFFLILAP